MSEKIACPKCGSTGGFLQLFDVRYKQWVRFDGEAVSAEGLDSRHLQKAHCVDCGKAITKFVRETLKL